MRADLLIHTLMHELRSMQRDAGALAEAAINDTLLRPIDAGFGSGMALAQQVIALRQKLNGVIALLEPEALEFIKRDILDEERDLQRPH